VGTTVKRVQINLLDIELIPHCVDIVRRFGTVVMQTNRLGAARYFLVVLVSTIQGARCLADSSDVQLMNQVISSCRDNISSIRTLQYKSTVKSSREPLFNQFFCFDRGRYRCNLLSSASTRPIDCEYAFDGQVYQNFNAATSKLDITRVPDSIRGYFIMEAVSLTHSFVLRPKSGLSLEISTLQLPDIWEELTKVGSFISQTKSGGHEMVTLKFTWYVPEGAVDYYVIFEHELAWFPVDIAAKHNGATLSEMIVHYQSFPSGDSRYGRTIMLPVEMKLIANGKITNLKVDPNSVLVNQPVESEIFSIPRTEANIVADNSGRVASYPGDLSGIAEMTPSQPPHAPSGNSSDNAPSSQPGNYGAVQLGDGETFSYVHVEFFGVVIGCGLLISIVAIIVKIRARRSER
jgi:hypothetical protein